MALKVKAKETYQNVGTYAGTYRYVMQTQLYTALSQEKVIKEAALRSGVSKDKICQSNICSQKAQKAKPVVGHPFRVLFIPLHQTGGAASCTPGY